MDKSDELLRIHDFFEMKNEKVLGYCVFTWTDFGEKCIAEEGEEAPDFNVLYGGEWDNKHFQMLESLVRKGGLKALIKPI
jgi:hypothetical protein